MLQDHSVSNSFQSGTVFWKHMQLVIHCRWHIDVTVLQRHCMGWHHMQQPGAHLGRSGQVPVMC